VKLTISWLKEYLDTDATTEQIADRLTKIGLEVESITDANACLHGLVVAEIVECKQHPNADRLSLLKVSDGKDSYQIVCGAPNCRVGFVGVLAVPGTVIPATGSVLQAGVIRGIESQGMMCSGRELKISDDHEGILELPAGFKAGTPFKGLKESDPVIEMKITPNRPDCLGIYGIARDLAASGMGTLKPLVVPKIPAAVKFPVRQEVTAADCPRLVTRYIKGIDNSRQSPQWLRDRLTSIGLRTISPIVDVTNYMSFAFCRPLHAFNADNVHKVLGVKSAEGEGKITDLMGKTHTFEKGMMLFHDSRDNLSIAGIMGGMSTACKPSTTNVILEAGYFNPIAVAAAGRKLGLQSDARYRIERGLDPLACEDLLDIATQMVLDICGGEASAIEVTSTYKDVRGPIAFSADYFRRRTGMDVPAKACEEILAKVGCVKKDGGWAAPSWRPDITQPCDLVEEVMRLHGYELLPAISMPAGDFKERSRVIYSPGQTRDISVRRALAGAGFMQAVTFSFTSEKLAKMFGNDQIRLLNPISSELSCMRPSVLCNLLAAVKNNLDRGFGDLRLFELGPAFHAPKPMAQETVAGVVLSGFTARHFAEKSRPADVLDAKAAAVAALAAAGVAAPDRLQITADVPAHYHPKRAGAITMGKTVLAYFGDIHPVILKDLDIHAPVAAAEVFVEKTVPARRASKPLVLHDLQSLTKDMAFVVDGDVAADRIVAAVQSIDKKLITDVRVFDVYTGAGVGDGKKSVAVEITLQPETQALTDAEIDGLMKKIEAGVAKSCGAALRDGA